MILVIDNFDSFVHNLARYFRLLGCETVIKRNDAIDCQWIEKQRPEAIVISPGPRAPIDSGQCLEIVRAFQTKLPMMGICLGHQVIVEAFGGAIVRSAYPMHGRASSIRHEGRSVFFGLPSPLLVGRYHSLIADAESLPSCLEVTCRLNDGTVMGVCHREFPIVGLQFHPESMLTQHGFDMIRTFLENHCQRIVKPKPFHVFAAEENDGRAKSPFADEKGTK